MLTHGSRQVRSWLIFDVRQKMTVEIREFARTGEFGPIKIGMRKSEVVSMLGQPDDDSQKSGGTIAIYSMYEFYFDPQGRLYGIQNDRVDPDYPELVEYRSAAFYVDSWLLRPSLRHTLSSVRQLLTEEDLPYQVVDYFGRRALKLESGVVIDFDDEGLDPTVIGVRYFPQCAR